MQKVLILSVLIGAVTLASIDGAQGHEFCAYCETYSTVGWPGVPASPYAPPYPPVYYPLPLHRVQTGPVYAVMPASAAPYVAAGVPWSPELNRALTGNNMVPIYQPYRPSWTERAR